MDIEWKDAKTHREPNWPFFGFAPGDYMGKCRDCETRCAGMDKRAYRCLPCAMDAATVQCRSASNANRELEAENKILRASIVIVQGEKIEIDQKIIPVDLSKVIIT